MTITAARILPLGSSHFLISYKLDGAWKQYDRTFRDKKDARRVTKSIIDSQGFNGLTDGGLK